MSMLRAPVHGMRAESRDDNEMITGPRRDVPRQMRERDIRLVRFLYCDLSAAIRGRAVHARGLEEAMSDGLGVGKSVLARNVLDQLTAIEGLGQIGEVRLLPDPESFVTLPYVERTAAMSADLVTAELEPWPFCPRSFLKRMLVRLQSCGLVLQAAFEGTFTLLPPSGEAVPGGGFHSTAAMNAAARLVNLLIDALEAQHVLVEQYGAEAGNGQHQLTIRPGAGLVAADQQIAFRETVRGVANAQGWRVSFAPMPCPDQPGNPCHLHFSLTAADGHASRFHEAENLSALSLEGRYFLAGVLDHLPGLMALAAGGVNSYRRLAATPGSASASWGPQSRLSPLRLVLPAPGGQANTLHAELRAADYTANPYLLLGAMTAAGLDGMARERSLPPPLLEGTPLPADTAHAGTLSHALPSSLSAALAALAGDEVLSEALGPELLAGILCLKRQEIEQLAQFTHEDEARIYAARL
jgi:glutamine synthetase